MPAVTSPRGYPYPLDGDPINVAGDIQKLAVKIDDDVTAVIADVSSDYYKKSGGTIGGNVLITGTLRADGATTINDRLDVKSPTTYGVYVSNASNVPGIHFHHFTSGEGYGSIRCAAGDLYVDGDNDVWFRSNNVTVGGFVGAGTQTLLLGKTAYDDNNDGVQISVAGAAVGRIASTANVATSYANLLCRHIGAMAVDGKHFAIFQRLTAAIGSITQSGTTGVKYNTTSDYRLKDDLGPIVDPVGKVMALQPKHLRWKADQTEFDGFIAHEVDAVVPEAVSGDKDAVWPAPPAGEDPAQHPVEGSINPQQLDRTYLIPILTAALQDALTRIAALEAQP